MGGNAPTVWQIPAGVAGLPRLAAWLADTREAHVAAFSGTFVFVPSARAAAALRAELARRVAGRLPYVLPLRGSPELALALGITPPVVVDPWVLKAHVARALSDVWAALGEPEVAAALEVRAAAEVARLLNRLAAYGVCADALETCVPKAMAVHWQQRAKVLIGVKERVDAALAAQGVVMPGAAERLILEQAAEVLATRGAPVVVAGVLDATVAGVAVARLAHHVIVAAADGSGGVLNSRWLGLLGCAQTEPVVMGDGGTPGGEGFQLVGRTPWDEARMAAVAVRDAVADGARVGIVVPDAATGTRVQAALAVQGIVPLRTEGVPWAEAPVVRAFMAEVSAYKGHGVRGALSIAYWKARLEKLFPAYAGPVLLDPLFAKLEPFGIWGKLWPFAAVMALVDEVFREEPGPEVGVTPGVVMMTPLESRLLSPDVMVVCGAVDGAWPAPHADTWLGEAQLRALGLPDARLRALLAASDWQGCVAGGAGRVVVTRPAFINGEPVRPMRGVEGFPVVQIERDVGVPRAPDVVGAFVPEGGMFPTRWSASFVEGLMRCPYRVVGERIAGLQPLPPLNPVPDAREGGLLAHAWLKRAAEVLPVPLTPDNAPAAEDLLRGLIGEVMVDQNPMVRAVWGRRLARLVPALVAEWVSGWMREKRALVSAEERISAPLPAPWAHIVLNATLDRLEQGQQGLSVIDFKTTTPPAWKDVAAGLKPQLPIEAWLLARTGRGAVAEVSFWQLRGYGSRPVGLMGQTAAYPLETLMEPVEAGLARLAEAFGRVGCEFPAVVDQTGGGLVASGGCVTCPLQGVCRRHASIEEITHG